MKSRLVWSNWCIILIGLGIFFWLLLPPAPVQANETSPTALDARFDVEPPAVSPGDQLVFTLTLTNPGILERQVTMTATLPAGMSLPLADLPVGASYDLRTGNLRWQGSIAGNGSRALVLAGQSPLEPQPDGRLTTIISLDDGRTPGEVIHLSATGWSGTAPLAALEHDLGPDKTVGFRNLSQGTGPLSAWWEFGDGTTSNESSPSHTFPGSGEYTVRLTVANPKGASSTTQVVVIPDASESEVVQPFGEIMINDSTPAVGQPIHFGNPSEPLPATVRWNFGDGTTSDLACPSHTFQQPGTYLVTRVLGEGAIAVQSSELLVVAPAPQAGIQVISPIVAVGDLVTFTALTTAEQVNSYYWDFGDGNNASHAHVAHSFTSPGSYQVTLAISNDFGVALDTLTIQVSLTAHLVHLPLVMNYGNGNRGAALATPQPATEQVAETQTIIPLPADPLAQEMLAAINAERQTVGLSPLRWSGKLARAAQHHTDDMSTHWFTGHYGSNGSRPIERMRQANFSGDYAGECTAWGFDNIASAVAWWMTSPPHRTIILSTVATEMGGAYSYNEQAPSKHYWTIDFGAH